MILLDAIYINNSGGKVLLDYLIENLERKEIDVYYLLDDRIVNNHPVIRATNQVTYLKAGLMARHKFYKANLKRFSKILSFGNLPPSVRPTIEVFTYFHQPLFIEIPKSISLVNKFKINLKMQILNLIKKNTDKWLVQSENVKVMLCKKYNLKKESVILMPFYPPLPSVNQIVREKNKFVYISNVGVHKNHQRLIEGFCKFYDKYKIGELGLTISTEATLEIELIKSLQKKNYPITNYGFIERNKLSEIYASSEYLIFPSLAESFGLGIVEAIESGCKVIGANLDYTFAICEPSIVFDPLSVEGIELAFEKAVSENVKPTIKKVNNEIENLIGLIK